MIEKVKKKILLSLAAAGLLYLGLTIYGDFNLVTSAFQNFNWLLFPLLLCLSMLNYIARFFKWDYYLSILNVQVKKPDSFSIFLSGLIMSITPGKFGELLKAYLVKQINGTPVSRTAPIIFAERITDFVSLMIIALIGAYIYDYGRMIVIAVCIFFAAVIFIISHRRTALYILSKIGRIKVLARHLISINNAYESSYIMLRPLPLLKMTMLSLVSWFFECFAYYLILINFNIDINLLWASFSYAFAIIVGAVSMLPGGLGVTEGSLTLLLIQNDYPKDAAVASTFIIRVVTLWFAVLIGIISVSFYQRRFGKINEETVTNHI